MNYDIGHYILWVNGITEKDLPNIILYLQWNGAYRLFEIKKTAKLCSNKKEENRQIETITNIHKII